MMSVATFEQRVAQSVFVQMKPAKKVAYGIMEEVTNGCVEFMSDSNILQKVDELVDTGVGIGIKVRRLDAALGDELFTYIQTWRAFTYEALGLTDDGLDTLKRHLDRKGE